MATKTATANLYRVHLQEQLRTRGKLEAELKAANEAEAMAQQQVHEGHKTPPYLTKFMAESARLRKALHELTQVPRLLANSCQDPDLLDEFEVAKEIQTQLTQEYNRAQRLVDTAAESRQKIAAEIRAKLGTAETLKSGELPSWETSGNKSARWAVRGDVLLFDPNQTTMHASNVSNFLERWREATRGIKVAMANRESVSARSTEAEKALRAIRQRMVDSPI